MYSETLRTSRQGMVNIEYAPVDATAVKPGELTGIEVTSVLIVTVVGTPPAAGTAAGVVDVPAVPVVPSFWLFVEFAILLSADRLTDWLSEWKL